MTDKFQSCIIRLQNNDAGIRMPYKPGEHTMIDFSCRCYHKDRTPIVKDLYIQEYAEAIVRDYRPELLVTPGKVDAFHFLESYLDVTVEFQDIQA